MARRAGAQPRIARCPRPPTRSDERTGPAVGIEHQKIAALAHQFVQPFPSPPSTSADRTASCPRRCGGDRRARPGPPSSSPLPSSSSIARAIFFTRATGRCATAPAEARAAASVSPAARRSGMTTPLAPAASAVRMIAPRFCGSSTPSSKTQQAWLFASARLACQQSSKCQHRAAQPAAPPRLGAPAFPRRDRVARDLRIAPARRCAWPAERSPPSGRHGVRGRSVRLAAAFGGQRFAYRVNSS